MDKQKAARVVLHTGELLRHLLELAELLFVCYMPCHLFGWRVGLLVASGLTSLLSIEFHLRQME